MDTIPFTIDSDPPVRGFLHQPEGSAPARAGAIVLTHGAGSNCQAPLLRAVAAAMADSGFTVLRCDLPYRQKRPHGPPFPGEAAGDREGLRNAVEAMTKHCAAAHGHATLQGGDVAAGHGEMDPRIYLGGHSYGGRQASMLAAEDSRLAAGLLLMSYPLHPPNQPGKLRTDHFPSLRTDALFVHGVRDPFASSEEIEQALKLIPAGTFLLEVEGAGHDLRVPARSDRELGPLPQRIVQAFVGFFR